MLDRGDGDGCIRAIASGLVWYGRTLLRIAKQLVLP